MLVEAGGAAGAGVCVCAVLASKYGKRQSNRYRRRNNLSPHGGLSPRFSVNFFRSKPGYGFDQSDRHRLRQRKANRSLVVDLVGSEPFFERRDQTPLGRIDGVVLLPPSEIDHDTAVKFIRWDLIRDDFFGAGQRFAHRGPNLPEYASCLGRLRRDVLGNGGGLRLCHESGQFIQSLPRLRQGQAPRHRQQVAERVRIEKR